MFFADKIILVEGTVERLLLHEMIRKEAKKLLNQYISIIEVGGAYALNFREFLEFINVKTLVITDIDTVKPEIKAGKICQVACKVEDGVTTCNTTLKKWLPKKNKPNDLIDCSDAEKTNIFQKIRVAYQIPEITGGSCGRSFEEAFLIKNAEEFEKNVKEISCRKIFFEKTQKVKGKTTLVNKTAGTIINESYEIAKKISKKSEFAFDIMTLSNWSVPKYIKDGLLWLEN